MTKSGAEKLLDAERYGFWTRTKTAPYRAVVWEPQRHEDGRQSFRGRNWVEVLAHGEDREPERYFTHEVETVGPHEWLTYYPEIKAPVCGWGRPRLPDGVMQHCPRRRRDGAAFCPYHEAELTQERNISGEEESGAGGEPVPAAQ